MERLGKYEIRAVLGRGSMGTVYVAWDPQIERRVAIKTVRLISSMDSEEREQLSRFRLEAQAAGRLHHPNIVTVFNYAETDELAYIVMEFISGQSLTTRLEAADRPDLVEIGRLMNGLLLGLDYSHGHQVIHRDIKPANIMITNEGVVKIADFGIARIGGSMMTRAGTILGTPAYMSPEQFEGFDVDARSDIYSAGVVLFQLLTGRRPFEGNMTTIMHAVLTRTPPRPSDILKTVLPALDAVVARALSRKPGDRYSTAMEFNQALQKALVSVSVSGQDETVIAPRPGSARGGMQEPIALGGRSSLSHSDAGRRSWLVPGLVAGAVVIGVCGVVLWGLRGDGPVAPPAITVMKPQSPDETRPKIAAALQSASCSAATGDYTEGPAFVLHGVVGRDPGTDGLRRLVENAAPGAAIDWQVVQTDGPYCGVVDLVRRYNRPFGSRDSALVVTLADDRLDLADHELIIPSATMSDFPGHLQLDYIAGDGVIVHLAQALSDRLYEASSTHVFGQPTARFDGWKIGPPFGTDLIVGIFSSAPLFVVPRPQMDDLEAYLQDLRAALDLVVRSGGRVSANVIPVRTRP